MIQVDPRSNQPIYQQIINQIKENIVKGIMLPGDKLPSIRQLSSMVLANPNTVSKAYQELERTGVIETVRGKGTFIRQDYEAKIDKEKMEQIQASLKKMFIEMHYMGISKEEMNSIIEDIYIELEWE